MNRPYIALSFLLTVLTSSMFCIQQAQSIEPYGPAYRADCPLAVDDFYGCWADFYWNAGSDTRYVKPDEKSLEAVVERVSSWDVTWWHAGRHMQPAKQFIEAVKRVSAWDVVWWHADGLEERSDLRQVEIFYLSEHDPVYDAAVYGISFAACNSDVVVPTEPSPQDRYCEEYWYYFDDAYFADLHRPEVREMNEGSKVEMGQQIEIEITQNAVTYVLQSWMKDIPQWTDMFTSQAAKLVARIDVVGGTQQIAVRLAQFEREAACERAAAAYGEGLRHLDQRPEIAYTASSYNSWQQVIRGPGRNVIRDAASTLEGLGTAMLSTSQRLYQLADAN